MRVTKTSRKTGLFLFPKHQLNLIAFNHHLLEQTMQHHIDLTGVGMLKPVGQVLRLFSQARHEQSHHLLAFHKACLSGSGEFQCRFYFLIEVCHAAVVTIHGDFAKLEQILDAGALHLAGTLDQPTVITPHAGELSRLLALHGIDASSESIEANPSYWAQNASEKLAVTVLLKGSRTFVAQDDYVIELPVATPWLATAGSGDVLAGILGALLATNYIEILNDRNRLADVAATAAFIHNRAALAASSGGPISASAIIGKIQEVVAKLA